MNPNDTSAEASASLQQWLIYRCQEPTCGTIVHVGSRSDQPPEEHRACLDCGGTATLQEPPRQRRRQGYRY